MSLMTILEAAVLRRKKEARVLRYAHAEFPALDYERFAFTPRTGREFLTRSFSLSEGRPWTGRRVLALLMTPKAAALSHDLDPTSLDLRLYGRCDSDLRGLLLKQGVAVYRFHEALREAFRFGLIYRVNARADGKTYYGVPQTVRAAFSLKAPALD